MSHRPVRSEFGGYLRFLRKRAHLTQAELGLETGYSESQICRFESGRRSPPEASTLIAVFAPKLDVENDPELLNRLLILAAGARGEGEAPDALGASPRKEATGPIASSMLVPQPATEIFGREAEAAACAALLQNGSEGSGAARLITLIGPPGVGKTRLAIHIAQGVGDTYPDGVFWIPLASIAETGLFAETLTAMLQIQRAPASPAIDDLVAHLNGRRCLLILDNLEQLLQGSADICLQVSELLKRAHRLNLLTTSQIPLHIAGEQLIHIQPLPVPGVAPLPALDMLQQNPAIRLFVRCAQRQDQAFALTADNALAVAAICLHLDGLPLAIELAAARTKLYTPNALLKMLVEDDRQRLRMLGQGVHDAPERHRSLENAIGWSYALLPPDIQTTFARLGVFTGAITLESAQSIAGATPAQMETLVNHSLITVDHRLSDEPAFLMLGTLRAFALQQLTLRGEEHATYRRHATYMLGRARAAVRRTRALVTRTQVLLREENQFRQAARWMVANEPERALRLLCFCGDEFWQTARRIVEGRHWLRQALAGAPDANPTLRVRSMTIAGHLAMSQSDFAAALTLFTDARALSEAAGFLDAHFDLERALGWLHYLTGNIAEARRSFNNAYEIGIRVNRSVPIAHAEHALGFIAAIIDRDMPRARQLYGSAAAAFFAAELYDAYAEVIFHLSEIDVYNGDLITGYQRLGELSTLSEHFPERMRAWHAAALAEVTVLMGRPEEAMTHGTTALELFQIMGNLQAEAIVLHHLGQAHRLCARLPECARMHSRSLSIAMGMNDKNMCVRNIIGIAMLAAEGGAPEASARLLAAARGILHTLPKFLTNPDITLLDALEQRLSASLGKRDFGAQWRIGRSWSLSAACEHARLFTLA